MPVTIAAAGLSDSGLVRENNEDAFYIDPAHMLFLVADGLGGHAGGEKASAAVVETVCDGPSTAGWNDPVHEFEQLLGQADAAVRERAVGALANMGSTVVAIYIRDERYWTAHAGDSRAYRLRAGQLERLTKDHTPEQEGGIGLPPPFRSGMITRAIGIGDATIFDYTSGDTRAGDRFLLCSDGLTDAVNEKRITTLLQNIADPETAASRLVEAANSAGGPDNVTVIVIALS